MAVVLNTQLMLDPNNQIAHLADYTNLVEGTEYVISANFLPTNTRFVFYGHFDIALTQAPIGVPSAQTEVPATISTVPVPAAATPPATYPYAINDRLIWDWLNWGFEYNAWPTPPAGNSGGAGRFNQWIDTSTPLPTLRQCIADPRATAGVYVASEWVTLGTIDAAAQKFHFDLSGVDFLGGTGGSLFVNGPITTLGPNAELGFHDRDESSPSWLWYAQGGVARLWDGADVVTIDGGGTLRTNGNIISNGTVQAPFIHSTGNVVADVDLGGRDLNISRNANVPGTATAAQLTSTGNINAAGAIAAAGYVSATGDLYGGNLRLTATHIYFGGATGDVNGTGGPLIYADANNHVYKQGPGNGAFLFQNYAGAGVANISSAGGFAGTSVTASGNINASGDVIGASLRAVSDVWVGSHPALLGTTPGRLDILEPSGDPALILYGSPTWQSSYLGNIHQFRNSGNDATYAQFGVAGCFNVSGTWGQLSDASLKDDITLYECGLEAIEKLSPVAFRYRPGTPFADPERTMRYGLVAQDVAKIIPEMVGEEDFEEHKFATVFPGHLVYVLVNAVKQLNDRLTALEA